MSKKSRKNVLIIGASGFVGQALTRLLSSTRQKLFLVSRKKSFKAKGTKVYYGDLNSLNFCRRILKDIDVVYYLAGYKKNIAWHVNKPWEFINGNVWPLLSFLEALKDSRVKTLIYLSTTHVKYVGLKEKSIDGYALGKYLSELALKSFAKKSAIDIKIVRSAVIYGPGDNFNPREANFIPAMIRRIAESEQELIVWGRCLRKLQFIYIDDLTANLAKALNAKKSLLIVGDSRPATINQIVGKILKLFKKELLIRHDQTKPDKQTKLNVFKNLVKPEVDIDQGLKKTINYYKKING